MITLHFQIIYSMNKTIFWCITIPKFLYFFKIQKGKEFYKSWHIVIHPFSCIDKFDLIKYSFKTKVQTSVKF